MSRDSCNLQQYDAMVRLGLFMFLYLYLECFHCLTDRVRGAREGAR
jgi:hypothetical protein